MKRSGVLWPKTPIRALLYRLSFLVGNHSSGKSSFINYILGRPVQVAGVAPTDDTFTVILPGPQDNDQDGPALIGDPDLGFSNLTTIRTDPDPSYATQGSQVIFRILISCWWIRRV